MSLVEVNHFDAIYFQQLDMERQMHAFDKVARINVLRIDSGGGGGMV